MPNHCENDLVITGPKEELETFREFAKEGEDKLSANKFIPYPEKFAQMDREHEDCYDDWFGLGERVSQEDKEERKKKQQAYVSKWGTSADGFNSGGYEWRCENWGTKWGMYEVTAEEITHEWEETYSITYHFNTAWSPPTPVIYKMVEMFPLLEFDERYFECGAGFNGMIHGKGGAVTDEAHGDYFGDRGG